MQRNRLWEQGTEDPVYGSEFRRWVAAGDRAFPISDRREWFKNYTYTIYPLKRQLEENGLELILAGWKPPEPFITPNTRVLTMGSCFAANFAEWLANNGYNQEFTASCRALLRNPFENVAVIAQQFRWAFGEVDPSLLLWIDKEKQQALVTEERRLALRQVLLDANVLIATLALSEVWYDKVSGEPLWRVLPSDLHDPERHAYKVLSFTETIQALEVIDRIRSQWLPNLRIVYTISPMPMWSTFRPISAVTANSASKAIVRGALDEFLRSRPEALNRIYFYFPSYEFVTALFNSAYKADGRHLHDHAIDAVLQAFASAYTTSGFGPMVNNSPEWKMSVGTNALIAELEAKDEELERLHSVCKAQYAHVKRLKRRLILPGIENWWRRVRRRVSPAVRCTLAAVFNWRPSWNRG